MHGERNSKQVNVLKDRKINNFTEEIEGKEREKQRKDNGRVETGEVKLIIGLWCKEKETGNTR